jgi:hypothetical protein
VLFNCRLKGGAGTSKALTIKTMSTAIKTMKLEIMAVEDCGSGGKYKAETWFWVKNIDGILSQNPSTFVVVEPVNTTKTRLRFAHFQIRPESDNEDVELESDNNDAIPVEEV